MTLTQLVEAIAELESKVTVHVRLIEEMRKKNSASISCHGSWSCKIDVGTALDIIDEQLCNYQHELGRLKEAKHVAEATMNGWLNKDVPGFIDGRKVDEQTGN